MLSGWSVRNANGNVRARHIWLLFDQGKGSFTMHCTGIGGRYAEANDRVMILIGEGGEGVDLGIVEILPTSYFLGCSRIGKNDGVR